MLACVHGEVDKHHFIKDGSVLNLIFLSMLCSPVSIVSSMRLLILIMLSVPTIESYSIATVTFKSIE